MILDPQTREAFKKAQQLFPQQKLPVSGCFNGAIPANQQKLVHINPPASVRMVQNKSQLFDKLAQNQRPVPKYAHFNEFYNKDQSFNPFEVVEAFGDPGIWADKPLTLRQNGKATQLHDFSDLLEVVKRQQEIPKEQREKSAVLLQPNITCPHMHVVTAIPNANGKNLRQGGKIIDNGILSPTPKAAIMQEINKMVKEIIDELDLDVASVTVGYDGKSFQVLDVDTRFQPEYAEPLLSYIELLVAATQARLHGKRK